MLGGSGRLEIMREFKRKIDFKVDLNKFEGLKFVLKKNF